MAQTNLTPAPTPPHLRNIWNKHRVHFERAVQLCDKHGFPLLCYVKAQCTPPIGFRGTYKLWPNQLYSMAAISKFERWWQEANERYSTPSEVEAWMDKATDMTDPVTRLIEEFAAGEAKFARLKERHPDFTPEEVVLMEHPSLPAIWLIRHPTLFKLYREGRLSKEVTRRMDRVANLLTRGTVLAEFKRRVAQTQKEKTDA